MRMIMKTSVQGPEMNLSAGDEHDFADQDEAVRFGRAGFAVPHEKERKAYETAVARAEAAEAAIDEGETAEDAVEQPAGQIETREG